MCKYSMEDGIVKETWIKSPGNGSFVCYAPDGKGNIYAIMNDYRSEEVDEDGAKIPNVLLRKFNSAAAYFNGQKTMDEVIDIIQNRAQLYVEENS